MVRSPGTPLYMRQHMDCSDVSLLGTNTYYSPALYSHCVLVRDPEITIMGMKGSWRELMPKSGSSSCLLHRNSVGWRSSTRSSLQTDSTTPWKEITRCSKALIDPETQRSTAQEGKGEVSQTNTSRNARGVRNRCQRDVSLFFFSPVGRRLSPLIPEGEPSPPLAPTPPLVSFPSPSPLLPSQPLCLHPYVSRPYTSEWLGCPSYAKKHLYPLLCSLLFTPQPRALAPEASALNLPGLTEGGGKGIEANTREKADAMDRGGGIGLGGTREKEAVYTHKQE